MGGLNLLFMASQSKPGQKGDTEKRRHSSGDNTALLELAEVGYGMGWFVEIEFKQKFYS